MRRREFIAMLGTGAAAWPLAARAQQAERTWHIGFLGAASAVKYATGNRRRGNRVRLLLS